MLNYELARVINLDRERDIRRAVQERSLRAAAVAARPVVQQPVRVRAEESGRASTLAASRSR
jgi:hypothetical protein